MRYLFGQKSLSFLTDGGYILFKFKTIGLYQRVLSN